MFVEIATGPPDPTLPGLENSLPAEDEWATNAGVNYTSIICGSQKIKDSSYSNFHKAGLIAFIVLGVVVIISPPIIIRIVQGLEAFDARRRLAWVVD